MPSIHSLCCFTSSTIFCRFCSSYALLLTASPTLSFPRRSYSAIYCFALRLRCSFCANTRMISSSIATSSYFSPDPPIPTSGNAFGFMPFSRRCWWFLITLFVAPLISFTHSSFFSGSYDSCHTSASTFSMSFALRTASNASRAPGWEHLSGWIILVSFR